MMSKTFDNGMICASEQAVIVDEAIAKDFEAYMKANNCYFLNKEETAQLAKYMFPDPHKGVFAPLVGKSANWIAEQAGLCLLYTSVWRRVMPALACAVFPWPRAISCPPRNI